MVRSDFLQELARKYGTSYEGVEYIFSREWQRLAVGARITQYLEILAMRRTRQALSETTARPRIAAAHTLSLSAAAAPTS
jgi:Protein of unknown function (DUF3562)